MPVQRQRKTKGRRDRRRVLHALPTKNTVKCTQCAKLTLPHQTCPYCGYYKGKKVVSVHKKTKKTKK